MEISEVAIVKSATKQCKIDIWRIIETLYFVILSLDFSTYNRYLTFTFASTSALRILTSSNNSPFSFVLVSNSFLRISKASSSFSKDLICIFMFSFSMVLSRSFFLICSISPFGRTWAFNSFSCLRSMSTSDWISSLAERCWFSAWKYNI